MASDPLVRMPGTQPAQAVVLEDPNKCLNCHDGYDPKVNIGAHWRGSMMSQAMRDPIFLATFTVALQDSIWALGTANAGDLCLRCHTPPGWLGGRSDPPNATALVTGDFDGVTCDSCHRMVDPYFEQTFAGTREGNDWVGYWDETNLTARPSGTEAGTTRLADRVQVGPLTFFNGQPFYNTTSWLPVIAAWNENGSGQFVVSAINDKRASFADTNEKHGRLYSRYHKSRYMCGVCHDVSNPVMANLAFASTPPGSGTAVLPSEQKAANAYSHVERTFSEFMLSDFGIGAGAPGSGAFAPSVFKTSRPNNAIATCQDCHMPDTVGAGCDKPGTVIRPTGSQEHPKSGQPLHDLTGGNTLMPWLLASAVTGSSNYDATNAALLNQGVNVLTLNMLAGQPPDPAALLAGIVRATQNLQRAASIENVSYTAATGALAFRIRNHTGHKLISGYPEGRRMFVSVRSYVGGNVVSAVNPYDAAAATLKGLPGSPNSPPLASGEQYADALVYEAKLASTLTGESHTFHFALATGRAKDNRIPPRGFRINEAAARLSEPVWGSVSTPSYFSAAEYSGGYDDVALVLPQNVDGVEVSLYYQSTSREYVEFLRNEIKGTGATTLTSPTPSGEAQAYIAQTDAYFSKLKAWGDTIWQLWDHNKTVPGAAPILMAQGVWGTVANPCAGVGSNGKSCNDGSLCTTNDLCASGVCVGAVVPCVALDQCHVAGVCDATTGICSNPLKPNGTACTDNNACTLTDTCQSGACASASNVSCLALDQCHAAGVCDPSTGTCSNPAKADGSPCTGGSCAGGLCVTSDAGSGGAGGTGGTGATGGAGATGGTGATGGSGGTGATGGSGGTGATGGSGGSGATGGSGGSGATGGSGGTGATGGSGGIGATGGSGGTGATGGSGGSGATGGAAGSGGASTGGAAGSGGASTGGAAGSGGASTGGAAGSGGASTGGAGGTPSGGSGGVLPDGGAATGGKPDAGPGTGGKAAASGDDGGCGCRTTPAGRDSAWLLVAVALGLARRRRAG